MSAWKPEGYPSLSSYVLVEDAERAIRFIEQVFDALRLRMIPADQAGKWRHAELRIDDSVLMIADALPGYSARPADLHLYVRDVDAVHARAVSLGATSVQDPQRKDDEDKRGGFKGPGDITWWVATRGSTAGSP
ncbi:MAG: VOC family protein [Proteobacteria bacterium]|nr:MAG: VOC family protein [Pseudomonadota bacterium]